MSSTSPYALRLQLITLAKELLVDEYHANRECILEQWRNEVDTARQKDSSLPQAPTLPTYPTEKDVLKKAIALYEFVSKPT